MTLYRLPSMVMKFEAAEFFDAGFAEVATSRSVESTAAEKPLRVKVFEAVVSDGASEEMEYLSTSIKFISS